MYFKQEIGKEGEQEVEKYLLKNGYQIIEKNFSCHFGEIDIIAKDKKEIVFIEVKTRTNSKYGAPSEAVNKKKKRHIYKTGEFYLFHHKWENSPVRIDVIEVYVQNSVFRLNHIKHVIQEKV